MSDRASEAKREENRRYHEKIKENPILYATFLALAKKHRERRARSKKLHEVDLERARAWRRRNKEHIRGYDAKRRASRARGGDRVRSGE